MKYWILLSVFFFLSYLPIVGIAEAVALAPPAQRTDYPLSKYTYYAGPEEEWQVEYGTCYYTHCIISLK